MDYNLTSPNLTTLNLTASTTGIPMDLPTRSLLDLLLAVLCIFCMLLGIPGNLLALVHFISELCKLGTHHSTNKRAFFTDMYLVIAVCDLLICSTIFAQIEAYLTGREPRVFGNQVFCWAWGLLWEVLPYYSVFLVGSLSISRLLTLLYPVSFAPSQSYYHILEGT